MSQEQRCPPRRLLAKRQRADASNSAYWKAVARSLCDGMAHNRIVDGLLPTAVLAARNLSSARSGALPGGRF